MSRYINEMAARKTADEKAAEAIVKTIKPELFPNPIANVTPDKLADMMEDLHRRMRHGIVEFTFEYVQSWRRRMAWRKNVIEDPVTGRWTYNNGKVAIEPKRELRVALGTLHDVVLDNYFINTDADKRQEWLRQQGLKGPRRDYPHNLFCYYDLARTDVINGMQHDGDFKSAWRSFYPDLLVNITPVTTDTPADEVFGEFMAQNESMRYRYNPRFNYLD